jgi:hypothetical protein
MRRLPTVVAMAALLAPASVQAADPVMKLSDVQPGMRCTALSVVQGTAISSFDAEILDVLDAARTGSARILVRVSGPAIAATGVGEGFSGSPVYCPGADGVDRNIGAISEGVGDYGGFMMLVQPIEAILSAPARPARTRLPPGPDSHLEHEPGGKDDHPLAADRGGQRHAQADLRVAGLAGPLTVSGLRPEIGRALAAAARRAGRILITSPATARVMFPPPPMVPGAAVAVGVTSGDVAISDIGTVAYVDGNDVWVFGHEFEGSGRRSLFLQDAYVHAIVSNPINAMDLSTYKLASPGNDIGTVTDDGPAAVRGRTGAPPLSFPLRVTVRDLDAGHLGSSVTRVADEGDVGRPSGPGVLGMTSAGAVADTVTSVLNGAPAQQSGDMCMSVRLRGLSEPARFCNTYTVDGDGPNFLAGALINDVATATDLIDAYRFGPLHPTGIDIGIRVRRGVRQAFLQGGSVRGAVRRGGMAVVRLRLRLVGTGTLATRTIRVRIPRGIRAGARVLRLTGAPGDVGADPYDEDTFTVAVGEGSDGADADSVDSPGDLAAAIRGIHRDDRLVATIGAVKRRIYRDPQLRISGSARVTLTIRR